MARSVNGYVNLSRGGEMHEEAELVNRLAGAQRRDRNALVEVACGAALEVSSFVVTQAISTPFTVDVAVLAAEPSLDLRNIVGRPAAFTLAGRRWQGYCSHFEQ